MITAGNMRKIGWAALLAVCFAMLFALSLRVNALRSEVRRTEMKIVALKREKVYLETEFETRANQQQLESWNDVEFGYVAPGPGQYLENVRQLAALGKPAGPAAPAPIRVAVAQPVEEGSVFPAMVSPLTGKHLDSDDAGDETAAELAPADHDKAAARLGERLGTVDHDADKGDEPAAKTAKVKLAAAGSSPDKRK